MLTALLSVTLLGFLLGMRHATDPDHVVAVTTIVTQQRSLARAARIGVLWGVGHTATIILVGGAIIVAKVQLSAIPPRVGLALEFVVALMLIVLGLLTLAGSERRVADSTARPLTTRIESLSGTRSSSRARPTTSSTALWRPTSSRMVTSSPLLVNNAAAWSPPVVAYPAESQLAFLGVKSDR